MTVCRSVEEVRAAALADAKADEPLDQERSDLVAAILATVKARTAA